MVDASISSTPKTMQPCQRNADRTGEHPEISSNSELSHFLYGLLIRIQSGTENCYRAPTQLTSQDALNLGGFLILSHRMQGSWEGHGVRLVTAGNLVQIQEVLVFRACGVEAGSLRSRMSA